MSIDAFPGNYVDSKEADKPKNDLEDGMADLFMADSTKIAYGPDSQMPTRLHIDVPGTQRGLQRIGCTRLSVTYTAPAERDSSGKAVSEKTRFVTTSENGDVRTYSLPVQGRQRVTSISCEGRRSSRDADEGDRYVLGTLLIAAQYDVTFGGQFRSDPSL